MKKNTLVIDLNKKTFQPELLETPAAILKAGGTVIFPTETVYGLGGNGLDKEAAQKIYQAKGRPADNPLIIHIAEEQDIHSLVLEITPDQKKLMSYFWPGPLTIIFKKSEKVPYTTTGGLDTVAIRMPSDPIARQLIQMAGVPVAAPSANLSGSPSLTAGEYVLKEMNGRVDAIIIHRDSEIGLESTVIDMTEAHPHILRPGKITRTELETVLGKKVIQEDMNKEEGKEEISQPKSPGMKYRHYAPKAEILVVTGETPKDRDIKINNARKELDLAGKNYRIVGLEDRVRFFEKKGVSLGKNNEEAAKKFFRILRFLDDQGVDVIVFEGFYGDELAEALMNRLVKASGNNVI